jgi:hypothetical protein
VYCRPLCLPRCPTTPAVRRSSHCCPSSTLARRTTAGVELGATYLLPAGWRVQGSYTGVHSSVSDLPENPLSPNTPGHQFSVAMAYEGDRISSSVRHRCWHCAEALQCGSVYRMIPLWDSIRREILDPITQDSAIPAPLRPENVTRECHLDPSRFRFAVFC